MKRLILTVSFLLFSLPAHSMTLEDILAMQDTPEGVVIEILEADEYDLIDLLPVIDDATRRLRERYPGLPIALVSHGREQFALTSKNQKKHEKSHKGIQQLVANNVDVHVCGTHASWFDISPEEYPDYIDVSPAGPAQINDYVALGYILLKL